MDNGDRNSETVPPRPFKAFDHLSSGAQFLRADLHLHSYGVSPDVTDERMTVEGIVDAAVERDLQVIAITDHNAIDAVEPLLTAAADAGLVAFPGVEVTTGEGHVLAYFAPEDIAAFKTWFGRLNFEEDASRNLHTLVSVREFLSSVDAAGGVAVPAHVGRDGTGFLARVSSQIEEAIFMSPSLRAVEVESSHQGDWYSAADSGEGASRRTEVLQRREAGLGPVAGPRLAKLMFSDAHSLEQVGRDRSGADRVTRIKMSEPGFTAFRTALADPDARIKLEANLPSNYPRIVGVRMFGGFLDGQEIAFSPNLTCLIGGRGTGKSTAVESIRCTCAGEPSHMDDMPNGPDTVQLVYRDEFGNEHFLKRDADRKTYELTGDGAVGMHIDIEGYDQDRIAAIIRQYREEPQNLLDFLDRFVAPGEITLEIQTSQDQLKSNADALRPLRDAPTKLQRAKEGLEETKVKLKAIQGSNLEEALKWRRLMQRERQLRHDLQERLTAIGDDIEALPLEIDVRRLAEQADIEDLSTTSSAEVLLGEDGHSGIVGIIDGLAAAIEGWKQTGGTQVDTARASIAEGLEQWEARDHAIEAQVQAVFEDLRAQGVNPNVAEFNRLTAAEVASSRTVRTLTDDVARLEELTKERRRLLAGFRAAQSKRFQLRVHAMNTLTAQLNRAFEEFKVKLGFREGDIVDAYAAWIRGATGGRFLRTSRIENLCRMLHPGELADVVRRNDVGRLQQLRDDSGTPYFADAEEAGDFAAALRDRDLLSLESIAVDDLPEISLTTQVKNAPRKVDFENLSFGQKASILLGALLFSSEQCPLIIDQPEDHLDSQFIARTVVGVLRTVKEHRQVIIATHNSNITVLGDAEQIVPLQGYEGRGLTRDVGSVDARPTRLRVCEVLEGGQAAYKRRGEMYGFQVGDPPG